MERAIRRRAIVQPGGAVQIQSDQLPEGAEVDVIVIVHTPTPPGRYAAMFGSGRGSFTTPEEADAFLRRERDAWDQ